MPCPHKSRPRPVSHLQPAAQPHDPESAEPASVVSDGISVPNRENRVRSLFKRLRPLDRRTTLACLLTVIATLVQTGANVILEPTIGILLPVSGDGARPLALASVGALGILAVLAGATSRSVRRRTATVLDAAWALSAAALTMQCASRTYIFLYSPQDVKILRYADHHLAVLYAILTVGAGIGWYAAGSLFAESADSQ